MSIYPFGYILIVWIIYSAYKGKTVQGIFYQLFVTELFFALSRMNYGYFMKIGGSEIDYNDVLLGILFVLSIAMLLKDPELPGKTGRLSILLLASILIGIVLCVMWPATVEVIDYNHSWDLYFHGVASEMQLVSYSSQSIMMFFRVIIFVLILNVAYKCYEMEDWISISEDLILSMRILIAYGFVELILKFGLSVNVNEGLNWLFGRGVSTGGGLTRLQGISREPSYYALALFNFLALSLARYYIDNTTKARLVNVLWMVAAIILGFASSSFSFLICFVGFLLVWIYLKNFQRSAFPKVVLILLFAIIVIAVVFSSDSFLNMATNSNITILKRVADSIDAMKKAFTNSFVLGRDASSEAARLGGGILSLKAGLARPLLGLGIGTTYCVTGLICIFANIGIVGLYLWIKLLFGAYGKSLPNLLSAFMLIPVLFCNDLYTLYDTSYLLIIPIMSVVVRIIQDEKSENGDLYIDEYQEGRSREISGFTTKTFNE